MTELTQIPEWLELAAIRDQVADVPLTDLFRTDTGRAERCTLEAAGLYLDFAKQRVNDAALEGLLALARARGLEDWRRRLFAGWPVNTVEDRAAYHVALRSGEGDADMDMRAVEQVRATLDRMAGFCDAVRSGGIRGGGDRRVRHVLNLGIGGSDLGPRLVCQALEPLAGEDAPSVDFIANVDGAALHQVLTRLVPEETLVVVTSKSFTTVETLANAGAVRSWLAGAVGDAAAARQFVAVTAHAERAREFGIDAARIFDFADWVGGRYSLWSPVGLSIALRFGMNRFRALLQGARAMDQHFRAAPLARNMPVVSALLGIWNRNFLGLSSQVVVPYSELLRLLPAYLQQLEMESNGKSVDRDGQPVNHHTVPVVWGQVGTSGQHAFFQMLHQGTEPLPVDFILPLHADVRYGRLQRMMIANCLAQAEALMSGRDANTVRAELEAKGMSGNELAAAVPHRIVPGNRPSSMLLMPGIDPFSLGALLALYEHKVFVQAVIWGINPFDQWGVELGKTLATELEAALDDDEPPEGHDPSTARLLARARRALPPNI